MNGEGLLNTYAVGNTSYGKGLGNSATVLCDNGTLEHLSSFLISFFDAYRNLNTVSDTELRNLSLELLTYKSLNLFHY